MIESPSTESNDGPDDAMAVPEGPVVIVQRGRSSTWRDALTLILLLAVASYVLYHELRPTPRLVIEPASPRVERSVAAVPVGPVGLGHILVREARPEDRPADADRSPLERPEPISEAPQAGEFRELPEGPVDRPGVDSNEEPAPAESDDRAAIVPQNPLPGPARRIEPPLLSDAADLGGPETNPPAIDDPAAPPRSHSEIIWDRDRADAAMPRVPEDDFAREPRTIEPARVDPARARALSEAQRRHFLRCILLAIREHGSRSGPVIDLLCRDFGATLPPELAHLGAILAAADQGPPLDVDRVIPTLRRRGVPEPFLLEWLGGQMERTIGSRHGPRTRMEAKVFAARKLLAIPLGDEIAPGANARR